MNRSARLFSVLCGTVALAAATTASAAIAPAVGDVYTYNLVNGYSKELRGQLRYEVENAGATGLILAVTPSRADAGYAHTVIMTAEGNWLRHLVESHGNKIDYQFAGAYPAFVFPLDAGKTWSLRVAANAAGDPRARSVRVDGKVIGAERIRVPAGEFDTIRV